MTPIPACRQVQGSHIARCVMASRTLCYSERDKQDEPRLSIIANICQACRQVQAARSIDSGTAAEPFEMCHDCSDRLENRALRPREWYNLASIHGWAAYLLFDDFYDDNGIAAQPRDKRPVPREPAAPSLQEVAQSLDMLTAYCLTRWHLTDDDYDAFAAFDRTQVLAGIEALAARPAVQHLAVALELAAHVSGPDAESIVVSLYSRALQSDLLHVWGIAAAKCLPSPLGLQQTIAALEALAPRQMYDRLGSLAAFRSELALSWIETRVPTRSVGSNWGALAARSNMSWAVIESWLARGRPLSLVALDAKSGRVKWHYQETPGDNWDFTATQPMILTRMKVAGEDRPVVLHAPKNGFLYVLDRRDGKLLSARPIVRQNWTKGIDPATGKPIPNPEAADWAQGPKIIFPGTPGARNWHPASYDAASGTYFAPVQDMGNLILMPPADPPFQKNGLNTAATLFFTSDLEQSLGMLPPPLVAQIRALPAYQEVLKNPASSELRAIDPLTGQTKWRVPMGGWQDRGGVLSTAAGLVFQGNLAGQLRVFDAKTGKLLKSVETGTSILAAPMTYRVGGVQYVAVMAAWGGGGYPYVPRYSAAYSRGNRGRILVFRLDGGAVPLPDLLPDPQVAPPPPLQLAGATPATIARGQALFYSVGCALCHSNQHRSITPDLRRMQPETHAGWDDIVMKGQRVPLGMPRWDDLLGPEDSNAIHAWLIDQQGKVHREETAKRKRGIKLDAPSAAILSNY